MRGSGGPGGRGGIPRLRAAALAALAGLVLAAPSASAAGGDVVVKERKAAKSSVADYWTAERIARARPLELIRRDDGDVELRRGDGDPFGRATRFESGVVPDPALPPNTVNGKLLGKIDGVGGYECSATAVDAANRSLIMTAGHCVAEPGNRELAKKLVFIPSYEDGTRPFGSWVFDRIVVLRSWKRNANFNYDFAAIRLAPQRGVNVQDAVGGVSIATRLPVNQTYTAVGYPWNLDGGGVMRYCRSGFRGYDPYPIEHGPRPIAMGCDMGPGASGGGWFVDGQLASVTSFGYQNRPDLGYGPYFGGKVIEVYAEGARGP